MAERSILSDWRKESKRRGPLAKLRTLNSDVQSRVIDMARIQFQRYRFIGPNANNLDPIKKYEIAMAAEKGVNDKYVAAQHGTTLAVVKNARTYLRAILFFVHPELMEDDAQIPRDEQKIIDRLKEMQHKSDIIHRVLIDDTFRLVSNQAPGIRSLLQAYAEYGSVAPLLDELQIPYTFEENRLLNLEVKNYIFSDIRLGGIAKISRQVVLARWLANGTSWNDETANINAIISSVAAYLFSNTFPKPNTHIEYMRFFLRGMLYTEFIKAQKDHQFYTSNGFDKCFISISGNKPKKFSDIDIGKTYQAFEQSGICPQSIRDFAQEYISGKPIKDIASQLLFDQRYNEIERNHIAGAGLSLLESLAISDRVTNRTRWNRLLYRRYMKAIIQTRKEIRRIVKNY